MAFGPKDHTIYGCWAILSLRVRFSDSEGLGSIGLKRPKGPKDL